MTHWKTPPTAITVYGNEIRREYREYSEQYQQLNHEYGELLSFWIAHRPTNPDAKWCVSDDVANEIDRELSVIASELAVLKPLLPELL